MAQECGAGDAAGLVIVNISSVLGITTAGLPQAAYSASKAGLLGLTRDPAQQWTGRKGIRVNAIAPGFFRSEMTEQYSEDYIAARCGGRGRAVGRWSGTGRGPGLPGERRGQLHYRPDPRGGRRPHAYLTRRATRHADRAAFNRTETSSADNEAMKVRHLQIGCEFTHLAAIDTPVVFQVTPGDVGRWSRCEPGGGRRSRPWPCTATPTCTATRAPAPSCRLAGPASATRRWRRYPTPGRGRRAAAELRRPSCPDDTLLYTLPSRYCLPDVLGNEAWTRFGALRPGYQRVQAICDHVHEHLTFQYGSSTPLSTAADVNAAGRACAATSPTWPSRSAGR